MKKWFKECPFCANEIKEKAIKCQYCWEFLPEEVKEEPKKTAKKEKKECPFCMNKVDADATKCPFCDEVLANKSEEHVTKNSVRKQYTQSEQSTKSAAINMWKIITWWCIVVFVWLWIAFLSWVFEWSFADTEGFNVIDVLISIWMVVLYMIRSNKLYNHLLNKGYKNLRFDSTWWPTRWWICPIACLFIPFQAIKDAYKVYNNKSAIVWWRWACYLLGALFLNMSNPDMGDAEWFIALIWVWFMIAEYILLINMVKNINLALVEED